MLPEPDVLEERRIAVSLGRLKHQAAVSRVERVGDRASAELKEAVGATAAALEEAHEALLQFPARPVAPYELVELLDRALETSSRNLVISSRTIDRSVVDAQFLKRLEALLAGGTRVSLSLGEVRVDGPAPEVERLRTRYPRLEISLGKRGQFHYLISDNSFAAVSNRPFLSNVGKVRSFHHVVGYLLQKPALVEAFARRVGSSRGSADKQARMY